MADVVGLMFTLDDVMGCFLQLNNLRYFSAEVSSGRGA